MAPRNVYIKFVHITKIINHLSYWQADTSTIFYHPFQTSHSSWVVQLVQSTLTWKPTCDANTFQHYLGKTNRIESLTNELKIHVGTRQIMGFLTSVWLLFGFCFYFHDWFNANRYVHLLHTTGPNSTVVHLFVLCLVEIIDRKNCEQIEWIKELCIAYRSFPQWTHRLQMWVVLFNL